MGCRISVSGLSVSWLSEEKAAEKIAEKFENIQIKFKEDGGTVYQVSLGEAGYSLDKDALIQELTNLRNQRTSCYTLFEKYKNYEIPYHVNVQEDKKKSAFAASHFETGKGRKDSVDAHIKYNEETDRYDIIDHLQGNQIDEEKLPAKVQEYLDNSFSEALLKDPVEFELNVDVYQTPEVDEKQEALLKRQEELNTKLENYPKTTVTYTFGDVTEVLNQDTIQSWVIKEEDNIRLDEDAVWEFIYDLATKYNTLYVPRYLESSGGYTVQIDNNEYGYQIDQQAEFEQLIQDLESGTAVEREPIYSHEALGRNGDDDLLGNYVEVSLEQQHLWMYKDGALVVESDIVSGQPVGINKTTGEQEDWSTYKGAYPIAYKESPATLSSDIYGYETDVEYWMPFVEGQGLHDAAWRGAFGGTIYQTDGSHGCINLPSYVAAEIFSYITQGYAVLIY
ncbi:MAG: L,D-transpeptidase family protein [Eubacteriales bacterium]|nr:L,D-transpeptidase family protein [Eubacteriales bacterium]